MQLLLVLGLDGIKVGLGAAAPKVYPHEMGQDAGVVWKSGDEALGVAYFA